MKSWRFLPQDMTSEEREVSPGAQAWVRPTTDPGCHCESLPTCQLAEIFAFIFTSIQCSSPGKNQVPCMSHPCPSQPSKYKGTQTDHSDTYLIVAEIQKNLNIKS